MKITEQSVNNSSKCCHILGEVYTSITGRDRVMVIKTKSNKFGFLGLHDFKVIGDEYSSLAEIDKMFSDDTHLKSELIINIP